MDLSELPELPEYPQGEPQEQGSDELLAADDLRLPEGASFLVRLHALRAWLARRLAEERLAVGEAALQIQALAREQGPSSRRRIQEQQAREQQAAQLAFTIASQRLESYQEAADLLDDYIAHTGGERLLVEYYLALHGLLDEERPSGSAGCSSSSVRQEVLLEIMQRIERVSVPPED